MRFFILCFLFSVNVLALDVQTKYGIVRGSVSSAVESFKGIPYASPPIGDLRWKAPSPPTAWAEPRAAAAYGPICPQPKLSDHSVLLGDEDCLTLNIWSPVRSTRPLPVMIFFHGGGNTVGSSSIATYGQVMYDGTHLAENGAVIVTINYRLGALGFLALPSLRSPSGLEGNYGLMDQLAALKFVNENIQAFGGDPSNVTVFGESAGAIDILALIASPLSRGLFERAIIESGFLIEQDLAVSEMQGDSFAKAAGCPTGEAACLRTLSADQVLLASNSLMAGSLASASPTIDGYVLRDGVLKTIASGQGAHLPVIIGSNAQEMKTLLPVLAPLSPNVTDDEALTILTLEFGVAKAALIQDQYPSAKLGGAREALDEALGDGLVHCPARALARAFVANGSPTYRYLFSHVATNPLLSRYGAGHAIELPYVFGNTPMLVFTPSERKFSSAIGKYWTTFALNGDPNLANQTEWPSAVNDQYLNLNVGLAASADFHGHRCDFWDSLNLTSMQMSFARW